MDLASIQKRIAQMEQFQNEIKAAQEMLKSELESDPSYMEALEEAKSTASKKKRLRDEIIGRGPNEKLVLEIKENKEEIKTLKQILTAELLQHYQETQTDEVPDQNGVPRKFQINAKVLPKGAKGDDRNHLGQYTNESTEE